MIHVKFWVNFENPNFLEPLRVNDLFLWVYKFLFLFLKNPYSFIFVFPFSLTVLLSFSLPSPFFSDEPPIITFPPTVSYHHQNTPHCHVNLTLPFLSPSSPLFMRNDTLKRSTFSFYYAPYCCIVDSSSLVA